MGRGGDRVRPLRGSLLRFPNVYRSWLLPARDLASGDVATLDPQLAEHLEDLVRYSNNGHSRGMAETAQTAS